MKMDVEGSFGEALKTLRTRKKLSRPRLAQQLRVHPSSIEKWERGDVFPDRARVEELIRVLGLSEAERLLLLEVYSGHRILPSLHNLPAGRNPYFTGRAEILSQLHRRLAPGHQVALTQALSGLGGIGKTQIALEYAYRYQKQHSHLFWVTADSHAMLTAEFSRLARELDLPERNEKDQNKVIRAVQRWLREYLDWLLILDNIEDLSLVSAFVPAGHLGAVLLTTRRRVTEPVAQALEVDMFSDGDGALFLLQRTKQLGRDGKPGDVSPEEITAAWEMTRLLGGLPLALDQAGAYTLETGSGLQGSLALFQQRQTALLHRRGGVPVDHPESVATTFSLAMERVEQLNPVAADLLSFCSFLAPDTIPEEILREGAKFLGPLLQGGAADPLILNEAFETLHRFSLVQRDFSKRHIRIHRLVQAIVRESLDKEMYKLWGERAVLAVSEAFPEAVFEAWFRCEQYLPHAQTCARWIEQEQMTSPEAAALLYRAGCYLFERAQYPQAEAFLQRALALYEQTLGAEQRESAHVLNALAVLYAEQGRRRQSEIFAKRALLTYEKVLGPEHPDVAQVVNNLAVLSYEREDYEQALSLLQRALTIFEKTLGLEHFKTTRSLRNVARIYRAQGKYEQAEPLYQRALQIDERVQGPEHPATAASLNDLAGFYTERGKYEQAEPLYQQAVQIREQILGTEHLETAQALNNLAKLYSIQGKHEQAEPLYLRALLICQHRLGRESSLTAFVMRNLAELHLAQGRYEQAELLLQEVLAIQEKVLGGDHLETARVLGIYIDLLEKTKREAEVRTLKERMQRIQTKHGL